VAEYIINSRKYGKQVVLLDDEDYERVIKEKYSLSVTYDKTINGFYVARVNRKQIRLGAFKTFEEAVKCRIQAEEKYFPNSKEVRFDR
jgi:hypothetical protein